MTFVNTHIRSFMPCPRANRGGGRDAVIGEKQMTNDQDMLFEWDFWKSHALALGVAEDLAELGRRIMRDAYLERWPEESLGECGWWDDGFGMLAQAQKNPRETRKRWEALLTRYGHRPVAVTPLPARSRALQARPRAAEEQRIA